MTRYLVYIAAGVLWASGTGAHGQNNAFKSPALTETELSDIRGTQVNKVFSAALPEMVEAERFAVFHALRDNASVSLDNWFANDGAALFAINSYGLPPGVR